MIRLAILGVALSGGLMAASDFDHAQASRFARMALDCVHREYPNKIAHSLNSDLDVRLAFFRPRALAFGAAGPALSGGSVRGGGPPRDRSKPHAGQYCPRGEISR